MAKKPYQPLNQAQQKKIIEQMVHLFLQPNARILDCAGSCESDTALVMNEKQQLEYHRTGIYTLSLKVTYHLPPDKPKRKRK